MQITSETITWVFVAVGVLLRLLEYADFRRPYMDERSLLFNLEHLAPFDLKTTLTESQLAAPGFLILERLMVRLPIPAVPAARLVPLVSAIISMFLMRSVARRFLTAHAVPIAVGLFALNDWLLYYSAEIKQYSTEVALTLAAWLLAAGPVARSYSELAAMSNQRKRLLTVYGAVGLWFSFPLAFVLAAIGTLFIVPAALGKDRKKALDFAAMSLVWAANFALCNWISHRILTKNRFIWDWWYFAFLPIPPRSLADLQRTSWQVLNLLNSPSCVLTPLGVLPSAFLALGLFALGAVSLARRSAGGLFMLVAPIAFAVLASALHQYPFHGRLLLFLVPTVHLLVAAGAAAIARKWGAPLALVLGAFLLYEPAFLVVWHRMIAVRHHARYDSHGDLAPDLLDYLEDQEKMRQNALRKKQDRDQQQDPSNLPAQPDPPGRAAPSDRPLGHASASRSPLSARLGPPVDAFSGVD
jgi:hypothetical protein